MRRDVRPPRPALPRRTLAGLLCVVVLVCGLFSLRWGGGEAPSAFRSSVRVGAAARPAGDGAPPLEPAPVVADNAGALLVSRPTPEWARLQSEGLFSPSYPKVVAPTPAEEAKHAEWDARVAAEWPGGCKPLADGKKRCLPRLVVMGQFKCGTTALFDTLAQHPGLLLLHTKRDFELKCPRNRPRCVIKEANGARRLSFASAPADPRPGFIRTGPEHRFNERGVLSKYDAISPDVGAGDERPVLEASPYYLSGFPDSFEDLTRLPRFSPGIKLIALVRNPVERAFSEYVMLSERPFRRGAKGCAWGHNASFEALAEEELRVRGPSLMSDDKLLSSCLRESTKWQAVPPLPNGTSRFQGRLLGWGEYARFAEPWMRSLPPQQLLFVKTEDLHAQPVRTLAQILAWAGLEVLPLKVRRSNTAACRGSHARGAFDEQRAASIESGACDGPNADSPQQKMGAEAAARLHAHFAPHNERFATLTGMDVSDWATSSSRFVAES